MSVVKVFLVGSEGRMGEELQGLLKDSKEFEVVAKFDRHLQEKGWSEFESGEFDLVLDFSSASLFSDVIAFCLKSNLPLVSGTTGITEAHHEELKALSEKVPVLWSPNMSMGVALFKKLIKSFAAVREEFQFQIEEAHHIHKIDSPSGTAKWLQQDLLDTVQKEVPDPIAVRGGGIFGIHKLWAMAEEETITIEHTALNRSVFAKGAVFAASWLVKQPSGLYSIENVVSE